MPYRIYLSAEQQVVQDFSVWAIYLQWTAHSYYFTDFIRKGYYLVHLGFTVYNRDQMDLAYNFA
jgi:hypothetical protein